MDNKKSAYITAGLRKSFRDGTSKLANRICYGYEFDEHGKLVVFVPEAMIVLRIFNSYNSGESLGKIANSLTERGILSPTGKPRWNREALGKLLRNEKYTGRERLQKTVVQNGKQIVNQDIDQYIYENSHPAIITVEAFEETQMRLFHRSKSLQRERAFEQGW